MRLLPGLVIALAAIVIAFVFASAYETYAPPASTSGDNGPDCGTAITQAQEETAEHADHASEEPDGPTYYAGGLWSPGLGLGGFAELAVLAAYPNDPLTLQSVSWDAQRQELIIIDVSPIPITERKGSEPTSLAIVSVDHAGPDISPEFATAIQQHLGTLAELDKIVIVTPLPGPDCRPEDEFPYDWTFLQTENKIGLVDWENIEPLADLHGRSGTGYIRAWVEQAAPGLKMFSDQLTAVLLMDTDLLADRSQAGERFWAIAQRSPYDTVPAIQHWGTTQVDTFTRTTEPAFRPQALWLLQAMGIHADELIDTAAASEEPSLRALAARSIGNLAEQTTDPLGRLTPLAEDKAMAVRYEALVATRAMPGRRAAGVAQLVEPYAMTDAMRGVYAGTMSELLAYGKPVQADSRADRLRRMPIDELLAQERDAIVCTILLEREDLPDNQIDEVLGQLAEANGQGSLVALLNLLEAMNPRTVTRRPVLLRTLARWKTNELNAQQERLVGLINQPDRPADLVAAAAGALIRAMPDPAASRTAIGNDAIAFTGLAWVEDAAALKAWAPYTSRVARGADESRLEGQINALDALRHLPPSELTAQTIQGILNMARNESNIDLRFAAIRAVNALPDSIRPGDIDDLKLTSLVVEAVPGKIAFDLTKLTAVAGRPVELTLVNPDTMQHNLAITRPGQMQAVGLAITTMNPSDAAAINYIPEGDTVLYHTAMLNAGETDTLRFIAPATPGTYPYVCTFPGHYTSMNGEIEFTAP